MALMLPWVHVYLETYDLTVPRPMHWAMRERERHHLQLGHQNRQVEFPPGPDRNQRVAGPCIIDRDGDQPQRSQRAWVIPYIRMQTHKQRLAQFEGDPDRVKEYMDYMTLPSGEICRPDRDKFSLERFSLAAGGLQHRSERRPAPHEYDAMNQIMDLGIPTSPTHRECLFLP